MLLLYLKCCNRLDEKWKVVRGSMSPTLTTGKIKYMSVAMAETIESWMETVKQKLIDNEQFTPSLYVTNDVGKHKSINYF